MPLTINYENGRFGYRVAGVVIHDNHVLIHEDNFLEYDALPGGRVELGETAADALRREIHEELKAEIQVGRLLWVAENFFKLDMPPYHGLTFYFLMRFPADSPLYRPDRLIVDQEGDQLIIYKWQSLDTLDQIKLVPRFLMTGLQSLPETPIHIVNREG